MTIQLEATHKGAHASTFGTLNWNITRMIKWIFVNHIIPVCFVLLCDPFVIQILLNHFLNYMSDMKSEKYPVYIWLLMSSSHALQINLNRWLKRGRTRCQRATKQNSYFFLLISTESILLPFQFRLLTLLCPNRQRHINKRTHIQIKRVRS